MTDRQAVFECQECECRFNKEQIAKIKIKYRYNTYYSVGKCPDCGSDDIEVSKYIKQYEYN